MRNEVTCSGSRVEQFVSSGGQAGAEPVHWVIREVRGDGHAFDDRTRGR